MIWKQNSVFIGMKRINSETEKLKKKKEKQNPKTKAKKKMRRRLSKRSPVCSLWVEILRISIFLQNFDLSSFN